MCLHYLPRKKERNAAGRLDLLHVSQRLVFAALISSDGLLKYSSLPWLEQNFGWTEMTATKYMRVAKAFGESKPSLDLTIDASALYLLAIRNRADAQIRRQEPSGRR